MGFIFESKKFIPQGIFNIKSICNFTYMFDLQCFMKLKILKPENVLNLTVYF